MPGKGSCLPAVQQMERSSKGISAKQILALTVTNGCQGVMLTMPFTVAVYMVRAFLQQANNSSSTQVPSGINPAADVYNGGLAAVDEQLVGQLTGTLAAVYSFSQFTTSYAWGVVSNRIGRKPIMILGTFVSTAGLIWFGLAGNFASAAAARALAGLLNGIIVAWKCMLGESCDSLTQGRVMSYMSLAWGVGCIAGPTIGGVLSQPCSTWPGLPGCEVGGFLQFRPYFLPCAVAAALSAVSLIFNIILLEETLPAILARRNNRRQQQQQQYRLLPAAAAAAADGMQPAQQQGFRTYQRMMSNSASPFMAKIMRDRVLQLGSSSSNHADLAAAAAAADATLPDLEQDPFIECQSDNLHVRNSSSSSSTAEMFDHPRFLRHAASARSIQLRSDLYDHNSDATTSVGTKHTATGSSSSSEKVVLERIDLNDHNGDHDPTDAIRSPDGQIIISSSSNRWLTLLRWDSAWQLIKKDSSSSSSSTAKYSKLWQQQQQEVDQDQPDMIIELGSISVKDQERCCHGAAAAEGAGSGLIGPQTCQKQQHTTKPATTAAAAAATPWYQQRSVVLSLLGYGNTCLLFCALDELTPMFASAPMKQGGLSLHEVQLAGPLAFNGVCLMFISLLAYPRLQRALGTLPLTRIGLVLAVITALLTPSARFAAASSSSSSSVGSGLIGSLPQHAALAKGLSSSSSSSHGTIGRKVLGTDLYTDQNPANITYAAASSSSSDIGPAAWAILYISMLLKAAAGCSAFTGAMILVNAFPSPEHLGQVNGVGQSLASLARGIGPAMGGVLWGATVKVAVPGAQMLPYLFVALSAVVGWVLYYFVEMPEGEEAGRQQQQGRSCCQE